MTWTHGVQEVSESGATNIFRSLVWLPVVENAMVVGTTLEAVVETRDRKVSNMVAVVVAVVAQATMIILNMAVAVVAQATMVILNMAVAVVALATMVVANMVILNMAVAVVAQATMVVANMVILIVAVAVAVGVHQCLTR